MEVRDFMPDEAVIAGIKTDLEKYEGERKEAERQLEWRVPVYLGAVAAIVVSLVIAFNGFADPDELWISTPHVVVYVGALFATPLPIRGP